MKEARKFIFVFVLILLINFVSAGILDDLSDLFKPNPKLSASDYEFSCSNADLNCDGLINVNDIEPIRDLWSDRTAIDVNLVTATSAECRFLGEYIGDLWQGGIQYIGDSELLIVIDEISELSTGCQGVIPSEYSCDENQTILKLSNLTNAHGSAWNGNYAIEICYDKIFGNNYNGANPHQCKTGLTNLILKLSSQANSHSENITSADYNINVCYGNLECMQRSGDCQNNEELIVSLSSNTNAHLSANSSYPLKICCSSAQVEEPIPVCGNGILETGESCDDNNLNDGDGCSSTCLFEGGECLQGQRICIINGEEVCAYPDNCQDEIPCDNDGICETGANRESCLCQDCHGYIDSCLLEDELVCSYETYSCEECPLGLLFNEDTRTCLPDPGPRIEILNPEKAANVEDWEKFEINKNVYFKQRAFSVKKDLTIKWDFGDGGSFEEINCLTINNCNTTKKYTKAGHHSIVATAKEQGGSREAEDKVDILTYKSGLNVFAIISEPRDNVFVSRNKPVNFNAENSFVAACYSNEQTCETKAGEGIDCYNIVDIFCFTYPKPGENQRFNYQLKFNWDFIIDKDSPTSQTQKLEGFWSQDFNRVVKFEREFPGEPGINHTARLVVKYMGEAP